MLRQYFSVLRINALKILTLAVTIIGALVHRKNFRFDSRLASLLQEIPLNKVLAVIVVGVGLSAILITSMLPLLVVGAVAIFLSFDRRATTKFVMMGGLSTALGALTIVDLPVSVITSMRLIGSPFTTTVQAMLSPYMVFGIAVIGLLCLGLEIELTPVQRDVLSALIILHRQEKHVVKGEEIAELMDRHPGTIRNLMQSLRSLNLVKGVTGPRGGYTAMTTAYDVLSLDNIDGGEEVMVPVIRNGIVVDGVSVTEIAFEKLMQPTSQCNGFIRITGTIKDFDIGDEIEIGPTPVHQIHVCGKVLGWDHSMNRLVLNITGILSVPKFSVKLIAQRAVRISPRASLREASRILINNGVQEALVEGKTPGIINLADITRVVAEGKTDLEVRNIMINNFLTINSEELIFEAIKILGKTGVSLLVVVDNGVPWGFVTPRNLIRSLLPY